MYRLALDLGTNSIGWCIFNLNNELQPVGIRRMGVRIFSDGRDPQSGASLAVERRLARQARRRRDRLLGRKNALMAALLKYGLMPGAPEQRKALEGVDPYRLRAEGLNTPLPLYMLGRAIWHINQRRGFKSNRKTEKKEEQGVIAAGVQRLHEHLDAAGVRTLGEYLYRRKQTGQPLRARPEMIGKKIAYPLYPDRGSLEHEFDTLWQAQQTFHSSLTDAQGAELRQIIFHQRPLKPVDPGRCSVLPAEARAALAWPIAQQARVLQTLNHMRVVEPELDERPLTLDERNTLLAPLLRGKDVTFAQARKLLRLDGACTFNLERATDEKLSGDQTAKRLGDAKCFGPRWFELDIETQTRIVDWLLREEDSDALQVVLMRDWNLTPEQAERVAGLALPEGYSAHCCAVLDALCEVMEAGVLTYAEARQVIGFARKEPTGEVLLRLPYYGQILTRYVGRTGQSGDPLEQRYGRIANPTVHIALNQVRRVVNELIKTHGLPAQVVLEVARDLKNGLKAKEEIRKRQNEEKRKNTQRRELLQAEGIKDSRDTLQLLRLWEELAEDPAARRCLYTGEPISFSRLMSDEVEVEHILPFARTLDDSMSNKTVCVRRANRDKGNRSPHEAFARHEGYSWSDILERVAGLSREVKDAKAWRFTAEAMERFDKDEAFLARQLTDTQYIARVAREYLCAVCAPNQVWVTPGRLTAHLADAWSLPRKMRDNHVHHARDAALIGVTERSLLQKAARHHAAQAVPGVRRLLSGLPEPWPGFARAVHDTLAQVVVSHKTDHNPGGALHDAQPYGILAPNGQPRNAQKRKAISAFTKPEHLLDIKEIKLRAELLRDVTGKSLQECLVFLRDVQEKNPKSAKQAIMQYIGCDDKMFVESLMRAASARGIRSIRIVETKTLIHIKNKEGVAYKGVGSSSNAWYDVYETADGTWTHHVVSTFDAHGAVHDAVAPDLGKHVMRLYKNDMVELEEHGVTRYCYVLKFTGNGPIYLVEHHEANVDQRNRDPENPFKLKALSATSLQRLHAKAVFVTPAGTIIYKERPCHVAARCRNQRE